MRVLPKAHYNNDDVLRTTVAPEGLMVKKIARSLCPPLLWWGMAAIKRTVYVPPPPSPSPRLSTPPDSQPRVPPDFVRAGIRKAHYGSADRFLDGWANLDLFESGDPRYMKADLTQRHPFPDSWLRFGFAEDFLEHLDQEQSLRFLIEVRRTLAPGGVLRLSFPGLEGVLQKHYPSPTLAVAELARSEAYDMWGHKHFYSFDELRTVAAHVGYRHVTKVEFGKSAHAELCGIEHRTDAVNTHAELTK